MKTKLISLITLSLLIYGISCARPRTAIDEFEVSDFSSIEASIVADVVITQSHITSVRAEGNERMLNALIVRMNGDQLILDMDKQIRKRFAQNSKNLKIEISMPALTEINCSGVGNINIVGQFKSPYLIIRSGGVRNITAENLVCDSVKIMSEGVGNIRIGGKTEYTTINSKGVGNVHAKNLISRNAKVTSKGVGNVSCHATDMLVLKVEGIGDVTYYGKPKETELSKEGVGKISSGE